jgi:hypothetical protein
MCERGAAMWTPSCDRLMSVVVHGGAPMVCAFKNNTVIECKIAVGVVSAIRGHGGGCHAYAARGCGGQWQCMLRHFQKGFFTAHASKLVCTSRYVLR